MWLFINDTKHRHIIYRWKWNFSMSMNSRSLSQNKASFGLDQLIKFCHFAWKKCADYPSTFVASGATILNGMLKWVDWHQDLPKRWLKLGEIVVDHRSVWCPSLAMVALGEESYSSVPGIDLPNASAALATRRLTLEVNHGWPWRKRERREIEVETEGGIRRKRKRDEGRLLGIDRRR